MDVLRKLTIRNLKLNKKRSLVTVIAIILSTLLITSVVTLLSSFQKSTIEYTKQHFGDYHLQVADVPSYDLNRIQNLDNIQSSFITQNIGYSVFSYENNTFPIQIINFSDEAIQNLGIELIEGWLPQNENEIVISSQLEQIEGIDLTIGSRISLPLQGEKSILKDYTLVGIVNITNQQIEPFTYLTDDNKCYTFISHIDTDNLYGNYNIYVRYSNLLNRIETLTNILEIDEQTYKSLQDDTIIETEENILENELNKYVCVPNNELVLMEQGYDFDQTNQMVYTVAFVIIIIIILTSAYCISNSFNISISERIRQYGMLSSIGTTSKQIKRSILYEAFILSVIAIPIGIFTGLMLVYLLLLFIQNHLTTQLFGMEFIFSTNIIAIAFTIAFSVLTIYLSARKPAKKISKVSPLEAIRSNKDIKIKSQKIKIPRLIKKMFNINGVIAYKNIKRNKTKYRNAVTCIIMSISAFIAMITFTSYSFEVSNLYFKNYDFDIYIKSYDYNNLEKIAQDSNIKIYTLERSIPVNIDNVQEHFSTDVINLNTNNDYKNPMIAITSLGDEEYHRFINKLGLKYEDAKDKGILLDYKTSIAEIEGKNKFVNFRVYDYQVDDTIQLFVNDKNKKISIEIVSITDMEPLGSSGIGANIDSSTFSSLIVSNEFLDEYLESIDTQYVYVSSQLYILSDNSEELTNYIKQNYSGYYNYIENVTDKNLEEKAIFITLFIFLYVFIIVTSLIGITSIFNTITTSMELRQKEFAQLKSIGMTKKEFSKMIILENVFLGLKAIIIGIPLGVLFSYIVHLAFSINVIMKYIFPLKGIIISVFAIFIVLSFISLYTLRKFNKQNIIETIRRDNI